MVLRILRILLVFAVALWAANAVFGPGERAPALRDPEVGKLFEKDLGARLDRGQLVVVDQDESDRYIQEDLSTRDLTEALTFARLKSEILEKPLYIENKSTFGREESVARVNPTDRRAWQELTLLEMDLKDRYSRAHPDDLRGYLEEGALDPQRTPGAMVEFIDRYPDSHVVSTALAHLEYTLCVARRDPAKALTIYAQLGQRHAAEPYLVGLLPEYRDRATQYARNYRQDAGAPSPR